MLKFTGAIHMITSNNVMCNFDSFQYFHTIPTLICWLCWKSHQSQNSETTKHTFWRALILELSSSIESYLSKITRPAVSRECPKLNLPGIVTHNKFNCSLDKWVVAIKLSVFASTARPRFRTCYVGQLDTLLIVHILVSYIKSFLSRLLQTWALLTMTCQQRRPTSWAWFLCMELVYCLYWQQTIKHRYTITKCRWLEPKKPE